MSKQSTKGAAAATRPEQVVNAIAPRGAATDQKKIRRPHEILLELGLTPKRYDELGSGLTARKAAVYDLVDLIPGEGASEAFRRATRKVFRASLDTALDRIKALEQWAFGELKRLGLPTRNGWVVVDQSGGWRWYRRRELNDRPKSVQDAMEYCRRNPRPLAWNAATAVQLVHGFRLANRQKRHRATIEYVFQMGVMIERLFWMRQHERAAERGHQMQAASKERSKSGTAVRQSQLAKRYDAIVKAAKPIVQRRPTITDQALAYELLKKPVSEIRKRDGMPLGDRRIRDMIARARREGHLPRNRSSRKK